MSAKFIFKNNISLVVSDFRKEYGASKTWIAKKAGISRQSLNSVESTENPTVQMLVRLAYALNCDIKDLYSCEIVENDND